MRDFNAFPRVREEQSSCLAISSVDRPSKILISTTSCVADRVKLYEPPYKAFFQELGLGRVNIDSYFFELAFKCIIE